MSFFFQLKAIQQLQTTVSLDEETLGMRIRGRILGYVYEFRLVKRQLNSFLHGPRLCCFPQAT